MYPYGLRSYGENVFFALAAEHNVFEYIDLFHRRNWWK